METIKLSSKGQLVLPKSVRDAFNWTQGAQFLVEQTKAGVLLRPVRPFAQTQISDVLGCANYRGQRKSVANMEDANRKGVRSQHGFSRHQRRR